MVLSSETLGGMELLAGQRDVAPVTVHGLASELHVLGETLPLAGAEHILPFNNAYLTLTRVVSKGLDGKQFQHAEITEALACNFGGWYFRALGNFAAGDEVVVPEAWRCLFDKGRAGGSANGLLCALGMNAHIVNDLPQALDAVGVPDSFYGDYNQIDAVIEATAPDLSRSYVPDFPFVRRGFLVASKAVLGSWRGGAWTDSRALRAAESPEGRQLVVDAIESKAARIGRALLLTKPVSVVASLNGLLEPEMATL